MRITKIRIENFRSIRDLDIELDGTTVFIGANNTGKTAILEAVRVALDRRWGRRGTGFTEHDLHCPGESIDAKKAPPVRVVLHLEENEGEPWPEDMVAALDDLIVLDSTGRNRISLRVTCQWQSESEAFEPAWEFLDAAGTPLTQKAQRATNLSGFFSYVPLFYLGALRDAADEFGLRSSLWSRLLKSVRIPTEVEGEVQTTLDDVDARLLAADPKLSDIATTIGQATKIAVGQGEGDARLRMLPMNTWDLISRASVVLKSETLRPWLPLDHHGQGLQSLAVIFLFQAAMGQQLEEEQAGTEPVLLLEEPEAHLHPQAARTVWERVSSLPGQKLVTTHSPYFVQNVPLHNLRLTTLKDPQTLLANKPRFVVLNNPWNESVGQLAGHQAPMLMKDPATGQVAATSWLEPTIAEHLANCFRQTQDAATTQHAIAEFRHRCRGLITAQEEHELSFFGRRIRGEIFFARRWLLVEGQCEYVLVHAIGRALGHPLDRHGIAVIDFMNNGNAVIYPALATSFAIPWSMVVDGDKKGESFREELRKRGFSIAEINEHFQTLPSPNNLEAQLIADGHEPLLREILAEATNRSALTCPEAEFLKRLGNEKVECISRLALRVERDPELARRMPSALVDLVLSWIGGTE